MCTATTLPKPSAEWSRDLVQQIDVSFPLRKKNNKRAEQIRKNHAVSRELRNQMRKSMQTFIDRSLQADEVDASRIEKAKQVQDKEVNREAAVVEESLKAMKDFLSLMQAPQKRGQLVKAAQKVAAVSGTAPLASATMQTITCSS